MRHRAAASRSIEYIANRVATCSAHVRGCGLTLRNSAVRRPVPRALISLDIVRNALTRQARWETAGGGRFKLA